ncbi:MAG: putative lipopolysaccharide heptosyltransferase III [Verrucomicrobiales bacterium]
MDWSGINRIGVFKLRNIGDVLITTPTLRALRQFFPKAHITAVVNSVTDEMLRTNPDVDELIVYKRPYKGASTWTKFLIDAAFFHKVKWSRFDLTFDFTRGDRPAFCSWLSGAKIRVATYQGWSKKDWRNWAYTHIVPQSPPAHEVEQHLYALNFLGIPTPEKQLCFVIPEEEKAWATALLMPFKNQRVVHVHAVARWLFKCWDDQKMAAVIDWLQQEKKCVVVVTSSPDQDEFERTSAILSFCKTKPYFLGGQTSLIQLAALSEQSDCFFGVDTAPMHIAAAVNTPVVALFGPTYPASWGPWCDNKIVLRKECACELRGGQQCDWSVVRACLQNIEVDEVQNALSRFLP